MSYKIGSLRHYKETRRAHVCQREKPCSHILLGCSDNHEMLSTLLVELVQVAVGWEEMGRVGLPLVTST